MSKEAGRVVAALKDYSATVTALKEHIAVLREVCTHPVVLEVPPEIIADGFHDRMFMCADCRMEEHRPWPVVLSAGKTVKISRTEFFARRFPVGMPYFVASND